MKDSEVLIKAREMIESREEHRLCYAIQRVSDRGGQRNKLTNWVQDLLGGAVFYELWLVKNHPKFAKKEGIRHQYDYQKARPGRIAWLNWMIEQCQAREAE